jgi:hypothetical protein
MGEGNVNCRSNEWLMVDSQGISKFFYMGQEKLLRGFFFGGGRDLTSLYPIPLSLVPSIIGETPLESA